MHRVLSEMFFLEVLESILLPHGPWHPLVGSSMTSISTVPFFLCYLLFVPLMIHKSQT